jgi:hypothetical protein
VLTSIPDSDIYHYRLQFVLYWTSYSLALLNINFVVIHFTNSTLIVRAQFHHSGMFIPHKAVQIHANAG